ncbi:MAG: hypothetical protein C0467_23490 [Planctomycetaceae bacterium]|nr:hypothetical protein [Planctomycetaceae bacterium]
MLRLALTYQLILAVAVGPWLCCCSAGRMLAATPPPHNTPASSVDGAPSERVSHSCCSHKHQSPAEKSAPSKPGQPKDKCPCKDGSDKAATTQAESAQPDVSTFLRILTFDDHPSFAHSGVKALAYCTRDLDCRWGGGHPLLTTAELLYTHHNLRC